MVVSELRRDKEYKVSGTGIKWRMTPYHLRLEALVKESCDIEFPPSSIGPVQDWRRIYVEEGCLMYQATWDLRRVNSGGIEPYTELLKQSAWP